MQPKALRALILFSLICLAAFPVAAKANGNGRAFGGNRVFVVHSFPRFWGWYDPFWGYYGPYYYSVDYRGKIKIKDANKLDEVYLNGAYAGTVDKMKNIWLNPGRYKIQIRNQGRQLLDQEVYVVTGKTVELHVGRG